MQWERRRRDYGNKSSTATETAGAASGASLCGELYECRLSQRIAYLDFGFIEPALLAAIAKTAKDGQAAPKGLDGHLVTRVTRTPKQMTYGRVVSVIGVCRSTRLATAGRMVASPGPVRLSLAQGQDQAPQRWRDGRET